MMKRKNRCFLCLSFEDDPIKLGKILTKEGLSVHYYCLLFSSKLVQNGDDEDGFMGFLKADIKIEKIRIRSLICHYCKQPSANVSCCAAKCCRTFHLSCGLDNQAVCQFFDTFRTICGLHQKGRNKRKHKKDETCSICYEKMGQFKVVQSVLSPCCRSGWFHKRCLAEFAIHSGYFFKCPLCNNKDDFRKILMRRGIFVPDKDAEWELEPNAYAELLERPSKCVAENCACPYGREFKSKKIDFLICNTCGAQSIHKICLEKREKSFTCSDCDAILNTFNKDDLQSNKELDIDVVTITHENCLEQPLTQPETLQTTSESDNNELKDHSDNLFKVEFPVKRKFEEINEKDFVEEKCDESVEKVVKKTKLIRTQSDDTTVMKSKSATNINPSIIRTRRQSRSLSYDNILAFTVESKEMVGALCKTVNNTHLEKRKKEVVEPKHVVQDIIQFPRRNVTTRRQSSILQNEFTPGELTNSKRRPNSSASNGTESNSSNDEMDRNGNDRKEFNSSNASSSKSLTFDNFDDNNAKIKIQEYSEIIKKVSNNSLESAESSSNLNYGENWLWSNEDSGYNLSLNSGNSITNVEENSILKTNRRARAFTDSSSENESNLDPP